MSCEHCEHIGTHNHHHEGHEHGAHDKKTLYINIIRLGIAIILTGLYYINFGTGDKTINIILACIAYALLVYDILINVVKAFARKKFFDENFLMLVATAGAMAIQNFPEACLVLIFYKIGEMLEDYATEKANKSIVNLVQNMPLFAHKILEGKIIDISPEEVGIGDILEIRPGEKVALDGILLSKSASLDQSSLTGESLPVELVEGSNIYSGSVNINSTFKLKVTKKFSDSTLSTIMNLITAEEKNKSKQERFITRFSKIYTPIVCLISIAIFLINAGMNGFTNIKDPLYNALNILIISCPCSLVISVPLTFFMGIGKASKYGILIKGGLALEQVGRVKTICFDKTGTLTTGQFSVINQIDEHSLQIAASLESKISHPIAVSIAEYAKGQGIALKEVESFVNIPGFGVKGIIDGTEYFLGSAKFMESESIEFTEVDSPYLVNYLATSGKVMASIICADQTKQSSKNAIELLKKDGVNKTVMLSGDNDGICNAVANDIGISTIASSLLPQEKVEYLSTFKKENPKELLAFVGDGINDSPSLIAADLGIAMGGLGSQAAIESADIVIMNDDLTRISVARKLSKKVMLLIVENITFILLFKLVIIILAGFNISNMILSIISDVGVMLIAILNSLRILLFNPKIKR